MKISTLFFVFFVFSQQQTHAQGQLGGSGGEMSPEAKIRITKNNIEEFKKLDDLSKKLIEFSERRFLRCKKQEIKIKDLNDLYTQLAGQNLRLLPGQKAQCNLPSECLMKRGPGKALKKMLKNKSLGLYLRVKMDLTESEAEESIRFFKSIP